MGHLRGRSLFTRVPSNMGLIHGVDCVTLHLDHARFCTPSPDYLGFCDLSAPSYLDGLMSTYLHVHANSSLYLIILYALIFRHTIIGYLMP